MGGSRNVVVQAGVKASSVLIWWRQVLDDEDRRARVRCNGIRSVRA